MIQLIRKLLALIQKIRPMSKSNLETVKEALSFIEDTFKEYKKYSDKDYQNIKNLQDRVKALEKKQREKK